MEIRRSHTTPQFERDFLCLSVRLQARATQRIKFFERDCFNRTLDTHRLHGVLNKFWSFSINRDIRIIFNFLPNAEVIYYRIGPHRIYEELERLFR